MSNRLPVLGGLSAEHFLTEYWQKKPLLVRNAFPEMVGMFEPEDIQALALEPHVSARLISQHGPSQQQWKVKNSPLTAKDFKSLPPLWTLLVQAVDHYALELAELWDKFSFIPQWRRDDVMVSYAPKGGSVGQHFDFYDVFLVQGHGHRRWQLGQYCDENTAFVAGQPLKLLADMHIEFDEILAPGDLLYVPPKLSHYGVAQDDCLTFSFGFRMPNSAQLMDRLTDQFADHAASKTPMLDSQRMAEQASGEINTVEFTDLKRKLLQQIEQHTGFEHAVMSLISEAKYPDNIPENDPLSIEELTDYAGQGMQLRIEPASRLLYRHVTPHLEFWGNGELLEVAVEAQQLLKILADGQLVALDDFLDQEYKQDLVCQLLNQSLLLLVDDELNPPL